MKIIGICGVYGNGPNFSGGQSVKVKTMIRLFSDYFGRDCVITLNTASWQKKPLSLLIGSFGFARKCNIIIMLPAHKGVYIFLPLFLLLRCIYKYKLFYSVIGGWLPEVASKKGFIFRWLSKIDGIWVETDRMSEELHSLGINNVTVIPNVKYVEPVIESTVPQKRDVLKCCTFSRVIFEKGIEDAIESVSLINSRSKHDVKVSLDIYGPIYDGYKKRFGEIISNAPPYVKYMGSVDPAKSVETLSNYDLQIFPTHYKTEGVPGSIIDSFAASVPVLASRWNSFENVLTDGVTGIGFEMGNIEDLAKKLEMLANNRDLIIKLSENCLKEFLRRYNPEVAMKKIIEELE